MGEKIELNGKLYEIGKWYAFHDGNQDFAIAAKLVDIDKECGYPFVIHGDMFKCCDSAQVILANAGTITEVNQEPKAGQYWLVRSPSGMEYPLKVQSDGTFADKDVTPIRELK